MRWSIIGIIFFRELRDQLRDRRTIFMVAVLPLLLYPVLGMAVLQFAAGAGDKGTVIGIVGAQHLPPCLGENAHSGTASALAWLTLAPSRNVAPGVGIEQVAAAAGVAETMRRHQAYPPLLVDGQFPPSYFPTAAEARNLRVELLAGDDRVALTQRRADLLVAVPPDFVTRLQGGRRPALELTYRENDERSRLAAKRLYAVLAGWKQRLREVRMVRQGLPADYDDPLEVKDSDRCKLMDAPGGEGFLDLLVRLFPFLLVLWSLAGALYPAVDLCAGEKERGTMETLLISPASRKEIVWGKFLTIWVFSAVTALLNLASMGITATFFGGLLPHDVLGPAAIFWCVLLAMPLSAFFSALCLAVGVYARSSKEGQYYLMPLFLVTMPLVFVTMAPSVELNPFYSLVPVTGVALLMQRLMTSSLEQVPWLYFVPVLAPIALYSGLALRWAIEQFKREEVLFREAERLELGLWLRRLFREKEPLPSTGQAVFCFALLLALRWLALSFGSQGSLLIHAGVAYLAFVAAPPLFMALLLTTQPRSGLALHRPRMHMVLTAVLLALLMLPPLVKLTASILRQFPVLTDLLRQRQPLVGELSAPAGANAWWLCFLVLGVMPAVFEELAFRGFILMGLRHRLRPWPAIGLSSLLFALYHMNVFQAVPAFLLGVVLGVLAVWSGSVLPGVLFHLIYNGVLIGVALLPRMGYTDESVPLQALFDPLSTLAFTGLALGVLMTLSRRIAPREPSPSPLLQLVGQQTKQAHGW
jgi:sodium transport system permease protein